MSLERELLDALRPVIAEMVAEEVRRAQFEWSWKTPEQAGELLDITADAVRQRYRRRQLPGREFAGRIYIDMKAFDTELRNGS